MSNPDDFEDQETHFIEWEDVDLSDLENSPADFDDPRATTALDR